MRPPFRKKLANNSNAHVMDQNTRQHCKIRTKWEKCSEPGSQNFLFDLEGANDIVPRRQEIGEHQQVDIEARHGRHRAEAILAGVSGAVSALLDTLKF